MRKAEKGEKVSPHDPSLSLWVFEYEIFVFFAKFVASFFIYLSLKIKNMVFERWDK